MAAGLPVVLQDGTNTYVYGLDLISATDGSGDQTYFLYDGLGSTTDLTDDEGDVVDDYTYDVFGAIRSQSGSSDNPWLFTGEQQDADSELYYLRARYYDPEIGRFVGQDPLRGSLDMPQTQNRYPYVRNNPARYVDPYGLFGWDDLNPVDDILDCVEDPKECTEDAGEQIKKGGQGAGDFFTETVPGAASSAGAVLDDLGYLDINGTVCLGLCLSGGLQVSFGEGFHPYVGTGLGLALAVSATVAPGQHITTGWNCGLQLSYGIGTAQFGVNQFGFDKEGRYTQGVFGEVGLGLGAGGAYTCIYVF